MINTKLILLLAWNVLWSGLAVEQLQITYDAMNTKNLYGDKVVIEKNGTKFLVSKSHPDAQQIVNIDEDCKKEDLWKNNFNHEFDFESSKLFIEFSGKPEVLENISKFKIKQSPASYSINQSGFDYLNYKTITFDLVNNKAEIPITLYKSEYESDYPVNLIFEAYGGENGRNVCSVAQLLSLHVNNYDKYLSPTVFYAEKTISSVNMKYPHVNTFLFDEDAYIKEFVSKSSLNTLYNTLPNITEETIALMHAYVDDENNWKVNNNIYLEPITDELVIGLFGDVVPEDLAHIESIINTLRVVAPTLKISYSQNINYVTLPIHFSDCTEEFSEKFNDCYRAKWGFYVANTKVEHGWVWVDSSLSTLTRLNVLTHEVGHALGLGHNLCHNSVMSYSEFADHEANYFTHIDLMMLQAIYDPELPHQKNAIHTGILVDHFDLDKDKIEQLKNDIPSTCHRQLQAYDFLVEMQKGSQN